MKLEQAVEKVAEQKARRQADAVVHGGRRERVPLDEADVLAIVFGEEPNPWNAHVGIRRKLLRKTARILIKLL